MEETAMKRMALCIMDTDKGYAQAFAHVVAVDHPGYAVALREGCADCPRACDVCLCVSATGVDGAACDRCIPLTDERKCAGVSAVLAEARRFVAEKRLEKRENEQGTGSPLAFAGEVDGLVCVYAKAGGVGASVTALGIARELTRYRGRRALYLCVTETEAQTLAPSGGAAMRAEAFLYHYLRLRSDKPAAAAVDADIVALARAAAPADGYGLHRLAPDADANSLSALGAPALLAAIADFKRALALDMVVIDFGTRRRFLREFLDGADPALVEVRPERPAGGGMPAAQTDDGTLLFVNPVCHEDIRCAGGRTEVGLANAFGLAVKQCCDRILGETPQEEDSTVP
jgi:hypothetical protein